LVGHFKLDERKLPKHLSNNEPFRCPECFRRYLNSGQEAKETAKVAAEAGKQNDESEEVKLPVCVERAWNSHNFAKTQSQDLKTETDKAVYEWLKWNGCHEYSSKGDDEDGKPPLPRFETWQKYIRVMRNKTGTQKNSPRTGRPHGQSIVSSKDVEPKKRED
jgi:hypothetical protein